MTLLEMSASYAASAEAIHGRIVRLRGEARNASDPETVRALELRIRALIPILRETRELAVVTARYYDRSYHAYECYKL